MKFRGCWGGKPSGRLMLFSLKVARVTGCGYRGGSSSIFVILPVPVGFVKKKRMRRCILAQFNKFRAPVGDPRSVLVLYEKFEFIFFE